MASLISCFPARKESAISKTPGYSASFSFISSAAARKSSRSGPVSCTSMAAPALKRSEEKVSSTASGTEPARSLHRRAISEPEIRRFSAGVSSTFTSPRWAAE